MIKYVFREFQLAFGRKKRHQWKLCFYEKLGFKIAECPMCGSQYPEVEPYVRPKNWNYCPICGNAIEYGGFTDYFDNRI